MKPSFDAIQDNNEFKRAAREDLRESEQEIELRRALAEKNRQWAECYGMGARLLVDLGGEG